MRGIISAVAIGVLVASSPAVARGGISGAHFGHWHHTSSLSATYGGSLGPRQGGEHHSHRFAGYRYGCHQC